MIKNNIIKFGNRITPPFKKTIMEYRRMTFWDWLLLLFIGLKLSKIIDWNWFFVISPILVDILIQILVAIYKHKKGI